MLHELEYGPMTALEAKNKRMEGGHILAALYLDVKFVFAAGSPLRSLFCAMSNISGS